MFDKSNFANPSALAFDRRRLIVTSCWLSVMSGKNVRTNLVVKGKSQPKHAATEVPAFSLSQNETTRQRPQKANPREAWCHCWVVGPSEIARCYSFLALTHATPADVPRKTCLEASQHHQEGDSHPPLPLEQSIAVHWKVHSALLKQRVMCKHKSSSILDFNVLTTDVTWDWWSFMEVWCNYTAVHCICSQQCRLCYVATLQIACWICNPLEKKTKKLWKVCNNTMR